MTIVVGPWGGTGGNYWDDGKYDRITKITIFSGFCIDSITVVYEKNGQSHQGLKHGGNGGRRDEFYLEDPDEKIVKVYGHYGTFSGGGDVTAVRSLTFVTNKGGQYGPYGTQEGTYFVLPIEGGHITSFVGRSGLYLDAIGFRISPDE